LRALSQQPDQVNKTPACSATRQACVNAAATQRQGETVPILSIIVVLVVIGLVLYLIENYVPMARPVKTVLRVVVVLALCIWLLNAFGIVNIPLRLT
jgi:hypothetical protein